MSVGDTRLRVILADIPQGATGNGGGWNRYDTDNELVLHLWRDGESWDLRAPKVFAGKRVYVLVAVILFVLAALGVGVDRVSLGWLGLAFFAGAGLV